MRSHSTRRETRLVPESSDAYGAAGPPASRDQRIPRQVHLEEAFLKPEPRPPLAVESSICFQFWPEWHRAAQAERSGLGASRA